MDLEKFKLLKNTIWGQLDKYGKLNNCTRKQLVDYCLKMQKMAIDVDNALTVKGVFVTFDNNNEINVEVLGRGQNENKL